MALTTAANVLVLNQNEQHHSTMEAVEQRILDLLAQVFVEVDL